MPTLLIKKGFRFFFFLSEPIYKVPHIHVEKGGGKGKAIFWLEPRVSLQKFRGLNKKELAVAEAIVIEYHEIFLRKYYETIGPKHR